MRHYDTETTFRYEEEVDLVVDWVALVLFLAQRLKFMNGGAWRCCVMMSVKGGRGREKGVRGKRGEGRGET